jgi:hypothetical protein
VIVILHLPSACSESRWRARLCRLDLLASRRRRRRVGMDPTALGAIRERRIRCASVLSSLALMLLLMLLWVRMGCR